MRSRRRALDVRWRGLALAASALVACAEPPERPTGFEAERQALVRSLAERGIDDARVLAALGRVPRERFVPAELTEQAYADRPLPIGHQQTISQPFVVAFMTEALELGGDERVLEIGTGSGYQAAVLAECAREVYSIEIVAPLAERAAALLAQLGYEIHLRTGDGYAGWPEAAPFDAILVTAAPEHVPAPLVEQLALGGRLVLPLGGEEQELVLIERTSEGLRERRLLPVRFVPMTGRAQEEPARGD
jgi:protein-L-isoaspartate(D-aspartate) O-methyltransferase